MLILASSSPYRRELLERLRIPFQVRVPAVDETRIPGESPVDMAARLARLKARAVSAKAPQSIVIGSDQVADLDGAALGKPGHFDAALDQLMQMRGRAVIFHTAICVSEAEAGREVWDSVPTVVRLRDFSEAQARRYLEIDKPFDCAGSAKIESLGIALVERVESTDPTALIGLPLIALSRILGSFGWELP